jgi:hypothetical protein
VLLLDVLRQNEREWRSSLGAGFLKGIQQDERIQLSVQDQQFGVGRLRQITAGIGFSDDRQIAIVPNNGFQAFAKDRLVIDQKNTHWWYSAAPNLFLKK